jgi:RimJ/RimL family protein N-acetyltransferase
MKLETPRVSIQLLQRKDAHSFFHLITSNRERLEKYFAGTVSKTSSLEKTQEYCEKIKEQIEAKTYFPFLLIDKQNAKAIGFIDFKNIDWSVPKAETGAFIDKDYEGKGLIQTSCQLLFESMAKKHRFKKLFCRVAPENKRSLKAVQAIGFQQEGILRNDYKTSSGELVDVYYFGILF